jgi:hypothetical protein
MVRHTRVAADEERRKNLNDGYKVIDLTQVEPVWGDLSSGFDRIADLADKTGSRGI